MATAVLVCSELATDAVRYAHVPGANFEVRVTATGKECLVEVSDVSDVPPCPGTPGADDERGRGCCWSRSRRAPGIASGRRPGRRSGPGST